MRWPLRRQKPKAATETSSTQVQESGHATASTGGVASSGYIHEVNVLPAPGPSAASAPTAWPMQVGAIPMPASAFQPRTDLRRRIDRARDGHSTVVLTQVLSGGGGVGKSQLAADYARQALADGTELIVWVNAAETEQITALYAQAAHRVQAVGAQGQDAEADAQALAEWLATTSRSWLVVLDDITDPTAVGPWWPPSSTSGRGRVLATTRRRDAVLSGGGREMVDIDTYTLPEATTYLRDRLAPHLLDEQAGPLARELGLLPLALAHAAAYMINEDVTCADYLRLFTDSTARLERLLPPEADTEGYGRQVAAALLLTLEAAQACEPVGLAVPAIRLAACLDPAGHPRALWTSDAVTSYLAACGDCQGAGRTSVSARDSRAVLRLLHRYGLLTDDSGSDPRTVRLHALTARAARETTPEADVPATVKATADAMVEVWPKADHTDRDNRSAMLRANDPSAMLRAGTDTLAAHAGDLLWRPAGHPVLYLAGNSLLDIGLYTAGITHWQAMATTSERLLGPEHPGTLTAHAGLAASYWQAGRTEEAIGIEERGAANRERLLGPEHPDTLTARGNLAASYRQAGRTDEATAIWEQVAAARERLLGAEHADTLTARGNLAACYRQAGRVTEATGIWEQVTTDRERLLGAEHPDTLTARANLAATYWQAGRTHDATTMEERLAADRERLLGPDHPDTLTARANLAASYRQAGRTTEAIALLRQVAADRERLLGPEHPSTVTAADLLRYWTRERNS
ncbi:tetratricopeptide repeat protein [Streptomyces sp. NPDC057617]|uniref:tetratricopeptide repeat protein n=1 Tax=Streptomyces sp. NPDC057617 TaxID=3346184 RepID=UPI0036751FA8